MENRNKVIKCMKHNSYGFTNWARFRNRGMYVLDPKATYSLEPKYESKKVKKNKKTASKGAVTTVTVPLYLIVNS
ncbi:hypothetical protein [Faecalibaculum rodentium]|uniref:hypothetical protein n=1 Tax=Faecalibaculum rodentium TaxID=1702221 RepID=UPI003314FA70